MWFQNWHDKLGELSLEHSKVWKIVNWWAIFVTHGTKNVIQNLVNFHAISQKSENLHFDELLLSQAYKISDEKVQKSNVSWHWWVMQSSKKNWLLVLKINMRNLVDFDTSSGKSKNLHFDFLHLFSAKKVQKSYLSWHWRVIQTLKKNGLFVWKRIWRTWWILTWVLESLKVCTLIGYFCRKYVMFELKQGVQYILILRTPDILLTFWTHNLTYGTKKSHKALHAMDPVD